MLDIALGLIIGLGAGVLAGLVGVGGGIVIVPALIALGFTQREASGTSLGALLLPVGVLGFVEYAKRGEVRFPFAVAIAAGLTLGAFAGAHWAGEISNTSLQRIFGAMLAVLAVRFLAFPA